MTSTHAAQKAKENFKMAPALSSSKMAAVNTWWIYAVVVIVAAVVFAAVKTADENENRESVGGEEEEEEEGRRILELTDSNFEEERGCVQIFTHMTRKTVQFYKNKVERVCAKYFANSIRR
jgi:hypothetical protein